VRKCRCKKKKKREGRRFFSYINENEKWACIKIYRATHINENEKLEILKNLKDLINQFVDDKYNEICIKFFDYLEINKKEIEYLIHYSYNNLNDSLNNPLFNEFVDTYVYGDYKDINGKCVEVEKRLEIRFDCGFIDNNGISVCRFFEINGTTELKDCKI
jgi:uncharacterized protein YlaN (UPF0358 family)